MPGEEDVAPQIAAIGDYFADGHFYNAITLSKDNVLVEAEFVAEKLGLTPDLSRSVIPGSR
jgi:hypothetical protein